MASKVLVVLLLASAASAVLGEEATLERREGGAISQLVGWGGNLGKYAIDKAVAGGHMGLNAANSMISYGADKMKSGANMLLRRDVSDNINAMLNTAMSDLNNSYRAATQLANQMMPNLSDRGRDVLNMYMNELSDARAHYYNSLQDAAFTANHLNDGPLPMMPMMRMMKRAPGLSYEDQVNMLQEKYAIEMLNYGQQVRRLGNVMKNNGLDL